MRKVSPEQILSSPRSEAIAHRTTALSHKSTETVARSSTEFAERAAARPPAMDLLDSTRAGLPQSGFDDLSAHGDAPSAAASYRSQQHVPVHIEHFMPPGPEALSQITTPRK